MGVTVTPDTFQYVLFDAGVIERVATDLVERLGLGARQITVEVDETTPLARIGVDVDPGDTGAITIRAESGAFEDTRVPRQQSETATATALGRVLLRARDRLTGGFADAPADTELSLRQRSAWECYCLGRLERLDVPVHQQRWRYDFRNRHGFTDAADAAFERLWAADALTWAELDRISAEVGATADRT